MSLYILMNHAIEFYIIQVQIIKSLDLNVLNGKV